MQTKYHNFNLVTVGAGLGLMLSLTYSAVAEKDSKPQLPLDDLRTFAEIFGKVKSDYVEPVEDKKLISGAINGMLSGLDPHSAYLDIEDFKDLQAGTQGEFGGLGMEVGMEDGFVKVISPIEDTPAYKAGIKSGDLIIKLDETPVKGLTLGEAVKRMRGKPDTAIILTVLRKGETKPLVISILRAIIKTKSVKPKLVESDYAYVRVTQFQEHTGEDLAKALKKLREENKNAFKGLVLDLRNNPGGLLNQAVSVSSIFLPKDKLVVYTEGRVADAKMKLNASPESYERGLSSDLKTVPLAILINGGSASASEIVAGALQDHKRGIVIGTQSFGKGSVQTILPMNNGTAIKLTTARYFTPNGRSIQAKGIVPDIVVKEATLSTTTDDGFNMHEADLNRHLSNPKDSDLPVIKTIPEPPAKTGKQNKPTVPPAIEENKDKQEDKNEPLEYGSKSDYQLNQALNLLKGLNYLQRR